MSDEKAAESIEIIEEQEESGQEENSLDLSGLESDDLDLLKKHDLLPGEEDEESDTDDKKKSDKEEVSSDEEGYEVNDDPDNFEEMDKVLAKDEKSFHQKYTPNAKALYFKQKAFKKRFQERDTYAKELEVKLQELSDTGDSKSKLDEISKLLKDSPDDLTIEQLQKIISKQAEKKKEDEGPITQANVKERIATKAQFVFDIGKSKHENFEEIAKLADEVLLDDKSGVMLAKLQHAFQDDNVDESQIVESLVKFAKLNDKYDEVINKDAEPKPAKESRIIKNSKKKTSSASIRSSSSRKVVNFNELTLPQLANLPQEQYKKVPIAIREKLLQQA